VDRGGDPGQAGVIFLGWLARPRGRTGFACGRSEQAVGGIGRDEGALMVEHFRYDVFIAYASADAEYAGRLRALLAADGNRVFRDREGLIPGDSWPRKIREAQRDSLVTVVLVSERSDPSDFQRDEIVQAIRLAQGEGIRRVVPVYLTEGCERDPPELLGQLQGIRWEEGVSLLTVAQGIEDALRESQRFEGREVELATIVIVTGCDVWPELFDRQSAYELKAAIDDFGRSARRAFLRSIVMGDIFFLRHGVIQGHPNVVSIGSPGVNALTQTITDQGEEKAAGANKRWKIMSLDRRWALFGNRAEDTYDAVVWFKDRLLPAYLRSVWSYGRRRP
jgi:hypothetical protein